MCRTLYDAKTANIGCTTSTAVQGIRVPSRGMRQTGVHMVSVMSRYIEADALKQSVRDYFKSEIAKMPTTQSEDGEVIADEQMAYKMLEFNKALNTEVIENAPSIDIVRCKECKYWEESQYYQEFMVCTYVKGATFTRQHDDFCSRGERKENE